ncbi:Protein of unknown function [Pyronema omphalodes CBS 100304]|uniref:Uncharacterized protein n=1 Tax=Pyronema omphalodes (strain CBS 100304) TaxID=1076935 RepID=U4LBR6_PYROM|nr:Protein of unknown function [Pyronema omphalodes CBS 100304]
MTHLQSVNSLRLKISCSMHRDLVHNAETCIPPSYHRNTNSEDIIASFHRHFNTYLHCG